MNSDSFLHRAEFFLLLGLAAFLPALEAPKNICMGLYLIVWLVNRIRSGDWGGAWSGWDTLMLAFIASGYLAALFAGLPGRPLAAGNDLLAHGLVFMAVRRTRFEARQIWLLLGVLVVATLVTLGYGYWGYLVTMQRRTLGLHSVGHVNHSAIYMAIVFGLALAAASASALSGWRRGLLWGATLLLFVSLLVTLARGAIIPAFVFIFLWAFYWLVRRNAVSFFKFGSLACAVLVIALIARPEIIDKTSVNIAAGQAGSYRPALARLSILAAREYPWFGVGPSQFHKISPELVEHWQSGDKGLFTMDELHFSSHAHGLYANTLAERGLIGLAVLLALLAAWGVALKRGVPDDAASPLLHTLWGGALSAWVLSVVGGFFNTTFHHEHAMVSALLIALWMSWQRQGPPAE